MANRAAGTYEVDPVSRIEGHLGIKVTTNSNVTGATIIDAKAHGNLWRGFENFLLGRDANDAITFVQRICGVCPVPHGMTSTYAVDTVLGYSAGHITFAFDGTNGVPKKAVAIRNLVLGMEFLMSSITHFYHLAAPSYIQGPAIPPWTPYFADSFYSNGIGVTSDMLSHGRAIPTIGADGFSDDVWSTVIRSYVVALRIRRLTFEAGALFAGRMPMTSVYIGGGVTFDGTEDVTATPAVGKSRMTMFEELAKEVGLFVIQEYVPIALALSLLYPDYDNTGNVLATGTGKGYGAGIGRYLSWGAFPDLTATGALALPGGLKDIATPANDFTVVNKAEVASKFLTGGTKAVDTNLTEDISNSRYAIDTLDTAAYAAGVTKAWPGNVSRTKPNRGKSGAYTYMKGPRWNSLACEVGPMARMFVAGFFQDGVPLATSLGAYYTAYVKTAAGNTGLDPAMVYADIAVALLKAGLATVRNSTVATALSLPTTTDFTYSMIVANLAALEALLGTTGAHDTIVAAYSNANTVITGIITAHVLGLSAGKSTMDRLRGRAIESLYLIQNILGVYGKPATYGATGTWGGAVAPAVGGWCAQLRAESGSGMNIVGSTWRQKNIPTGTVSGWGGTEAPRGALMHTITITAGKITKYQCIVPTTWNGSPAVGAVTPGSIANHGAIEAACIGAPFDAATKTYAIPGTTGTITNAAGGVEVLRIAQSFDPCIACAIH